MKGVPTVISFLILKISTRKKKKNGATEYFTFNLSL